MRTRNPPQATGSVWLTWYQAQGADYRISFQSVVPAMALPSAQRFAGLVPHDSGDVCSGAGFDSPRRPGSSPVPTVETAAGDCPARCADG